MPLYLACGLIGRQLLRTIISNVIKAVLECDLVKNPLYDEQALNHNDYHRDIDRAVLFHPPTSLKAPDLLNCVFSDMNTLKESLRTD